MAYPNSKRPLSHYSELAEKGRQATNDLNDIQRELMFKQAQALIYGRDKDKGKAAVSGSR